MQLSIIIVNYNVKYFLEHCLLSVIKACANINAEILVVDNNSTDGSESYLTPKFPSVKFYWNKSNLGFGKANNSALKDATGDYILFLNPDTIVPEECFKKCISFFQTHTDAGALGVRMIDGSGHFLKESKRCLPTPAAGFFKMVGLAGLFPSSSFFAKYYAGHLPEKENNKSEVLAGAFMMLSKAAIEKTHGFDENFFMYGEDIDLSYRMLQAGLQNYYLGEATIIHFKGESTQKKNNSFIQHFYGAMKLFVDKHYNNQYFLQVSMKCMINFAKLFAKIKNSLSSTVSKSYTRKQFNILFYGSDKQYDMINIGLESKNITVSQKFIVDDTTSLENLQIGKISNADVNAQLFCEGLISNTFIINQLSILPNNHTALFFEDGANSIIASSNKNERGFFISIR